MGPSVSEPKIAKGGDAVADPERLQLDSVATEAWEVVDTSGARLETAGEPVVRADRSRLRQLLENLFANAVEHGHPEDSSGPGRTDVTVRVGTVPDGFYVADDGAGIPPADRETVFETGFSTDEHGTGFGLSIVSQIAEAHGWDIRVTESDQGGARFEFLQTDAEQ